VTPREARALSRSVRMIVDLWIRSGHVTMPVESRHACIVGGSGLAKLVFGWARILRFPMNLG